MCPSSSSSSSFSSFFFMFILCFFLSTTCRLFIAENCVFTVFPHFFLPSLFFNPFFLTCLLHLLPSSSVFFLSSLCFLSQQFGSEHLLQLSFSFHDVIVFSGVSSSSSGVSAVVLWCFRAFRTRGSRRSSSRRKWAGSGSSAAVGSSESCGGAATWS